MCVILLTVVPMAPLSLKEARQVARTRADGASPKFAPGATLPPSFQTSLKSLETEILITDPADGGGGHGARSPMYLVGAIATLFGSPVAPPVITADVVFPASTAALTDYVLARLEMQFDPRVVGEVVQDVLDVYALVYMYVYISIYIFICIYILYINIYKRTHTNTRILIYIYIYIFIYMNI